MHILVSKFLRKFIFPSLFFVSKFEDQGIGCGGNLTSFNGTFTTPMYPDFFYQEKTKNCIWNVHSLGQQKLTLHFDNFEFNSSKSCDFNYLEIYDGEVMSNDTYLLKLCGQVSNFTF